MRVGVDATCWQNNRGYGRHARALLCALVDLDAADQYTFFVDTLRGLETVPPEVEVRLVRASEPTTVAASFNGHRTAGDMWRMSRALSDPALDVLLFPTVYSFVPVLSRAKKVVMIHDVIAEQLPAGYLPKRSARLFWKTKVLLGRWQADAIATVSDYSRKGILRAFSAAP